ncbi:RCC1 domain-containing protein [Brumimicrobium mesophilum]|uniref:RCC1 domain-containing protein n=1 Tax=Brumimicrobium mesophilum TaxID=392717 RepID=UPI000D144544|nr:T9SS type A sorting domain-containing protein [Brumimicrobium mesophilum]
MKKLILLAFTFLGLNVFAQNTWVELSAGTEFSAGIQSDGTLWTWGSNMNEQLGLGDAITRAIPTQVGTDTNWSSISCGAFHSLAIKNDGTLWAWGENSLFQLGNGNTTQLSTPTQVGTDNDWASINAGYAHNHAIKTDGTLWAWGWNLYGQIGDNSNIDLAIPTQIGTATNWEFIDSGAGHTLALKTDGTLWGWGFNANGQLGIISSTEIKEPTQIGTSLWNDISCGYEYSSGIKADGTLWSWGFNGNSQLGLGTIPQADEPTQVGTSSDWETIRSGAASNFAINSSSELFGTGFNQFGTLGDGSGVNKSSFTLITDDVDMVYVSEGGAGQGGIFGHHTFLLRNSDKTVICAAGSNYISQIGDGGSADILTFTCNVGDLDNVGLTAEQKGVNFKVYPNPASDFATIEFDGKTPAQFTLYSTSGAQVFSQEINSGQKVEFKSLELGIYFYEIMKENGELEKGKLILK